MDKICDGNPSQIGSQWPLWRGWKTNYHIETAVYNKLITLSNGLMFIASTTTGIIEVYSRTKLHVYI